MVRHMVRDVVKYGHWDDYVAACKAWNGEAVRLGLPAYRLSSSDWGTMNETFFEAEFESSADIEARFKAAMTDEGFRAASRAVSEHMVDGASRDYVLSELSFD
jgi:hypothetical protein